MMEKELGDSTYSPYSYYFICLIGMIAILGSTMAKNPTLALFTSQLGATDWQLGIIAAIGPIPGIFLSAPAGAFADRVLPSFTCLLSKPGNLFRYDSFMV
jgi:hypothetical protein